MIRYQAAAIALKLFSTNSATRSLYRRLGNSRGNRKTTDFRGSYVERARWLIGNLREAGVLDGRPFSALEIGTGWMHYYGIILSLVGARPIDLYDQWDNRQFLRLRRSFTGFHRHFDDLGLTAADRITASTALDAVLESNNFEELYSSLGMRYIVEPSGTLTSLPLARYDVVCSLDVLEHVDESKLSEFVRMMAAVLKPDGLSLHQIGLDDHLTHYDASTREKQLLHYGRRTWDLRFRNRIQYVNRVSLDSFRKLFRCADLDEISSESKQNPNAFVAHKVADCFRDQSTESLAAVRAFMVHRRPAY